MTWAAILSVLPFLKVIGGALAVCWAWFMIKTKETEKQGRISAETTVQEKDKIIEEHENEKQYQASAFARLESSKKLSDKRSDVLLEKLKTIDPSHLNDIELSELYADPLGFKTDIPTHPERVDPSKKAPVRKR